MRYFVGFSAGAVMGFLVFFFGKCTSGTCPLTSNAAVTVLVGGLLGIMLAAKPKEIQRTENREQETEKNSKRP